MGLQQQKIHELRFVEMDKHRGQIEAHQIYESFLIFKESIIIFY